MNPWFIDAIDPRAGLAFATRRRDDLLSSEILDGDPSAFIAPPFFVPEYVDGRSLGMGLGRARAQLGLFSGGREVPFTSSADVAEFVRRTYLRGSGGNGPGEEGVPPLPTPEGPTEPSEPPGFEVEGLGEKGDPALALLEQAKAMDALSNHLAFGTSEEVRERSLAAPPPAAAAARLVSAALNLHNEILRRSQLPPSSSPATDWVQTLGLLFEVCTRLGLLPLLHKEMHRNPALVKWLEERGLPSFSDWSFFNHWHVWPFGAPLMPMDPYEDLCRLPVPDWLAVPADDFIKPNPSLRGVLQTVLATPAERLLPPADGTARAELAFFAACYLMTAGERPPLLLSVDHSRSYIAGIAARAQTWLTANLPQRVFSPEVENVIVGADRVPA